MQAQIHPKSETVTVYCSNCDNQFQTRSTLCRDIHVEACSNCHHIYTGQKRQARAKGKVEQFRNRFGDL